MLARVCVADADSALFCLQDVPVAAPAPKKKKERSREKETVATNSSTGAKPPNDSKGNRHSKTPPQKSVGDATKQNPKATEQSAAKKSSVAAAGKPPQQPATNVANVAPPPARAPPTQRLPPQPQQTATAVSVAARPARTATPPLAVATPVTKLESQLQTRSVPTPTVLQAVAPPPTAAPRGVAVVPPERKASPSANTVTPTRQAAAVPTSAKAGSALVRTGAEKVILPIKPAPVVKSGTAVAVVATSVAPSKPAGASTASKFTSQATGVKRPCPATAAAVPPPAPAAAKKAKQTTTTTSSQPSLDKVQYTVGPLAAFSDKLRELYAQGLTTGNWSIMTMLSQLFNEVRDWHFLSKMVYPLMVVLTMLCFAMCRKYCIAQTSSAPVLQARSLRSERAPTSMSCKLRGRFACISCTS